MQPYVLLGVVLDGQGECPIPVVPVHALWSFITLQEVKAALDAAIAAFARRADLAEALWERLLQSVVVAPNPFNGDLSSLMAAVPRYDITYQLNEVEVRMHHCTQPSAP